MTKRLAENKKVKILNDKKINEIIIKNKKNEVIIDKHKYECEYLFDSRNSLIKKRWVISTFCWL